MRDSLLELCAEVLDAIEGDRLGEAAALARGLQRMISALPTLEEQLGCSVRLAEAVLNNRRQDPRMVLESGRPDWNAEEE